MHASLLNDQANMDTWSQKKYLIRTESKLLLKYNLIIYLYTSSIKKVCTGDGAAAHADEAPNAAWTPSGCCNRKSVQELTFCIEQLFVGVF